MGVHYSSSTFLFKGNNGDILKLVHVTQSNLTQIPAFVNFSLGLRFLERKFSKKYLDFGKNQWRMGTSLHRLNGHGKHNMFLELEFERLRAENIWCTECRQSTHCKLRNGDILT